MESICNHNGNCRAKPEGQIEKEESDKVNNKDANFVQTEVWNSFEMLAEVEPRVNAMLTGEGNKVDKVHDAELTDPSSPVREEPLVEFWEVLSRGRC
ncbi:hypothetical protein LIER_42386 [Lithospermum erythrorhizon]|uniref:Uncharacterized protein n=1 Tax=Lithospermum erythrorhizon TaxID=34254 RepID=A0AAV3RSG0_LITER